VRITEILTEGKKPSQTPPPRPKRQAAPKPDATQTPDSAEASGATA